MMSQNIIPEQSSPTRSLSSGQMDERFNDNKLPYGWFAEGWKVDSTGVAKKGGFSFDISELLGGLGNQTNGNEPDGNATGSALEFYSVFMQMMPIVSVSGTSE